LEVKFKSTANHPKIMPIDKKVSDVLRKISYRIKEDSALLTDLPGEYAGMRDEMDAYTIKNFVNIACNHLFDDHPKVYGITELEGHILRSFFSGLIDDFKLVPDLLGEFPELFKRIGDEEYLQEVNERRAMRGLEPILSNQK
jgi:hypothetical protein